MRSVFQDIGYGVRIMRRNPRFSLTLVCVLGIGIGGASTMFTMLYEVILQPLGFTNPERLVMLGAPTPPDGDGLLNMISEGRALDFSLSSRILPGNLIICASDLTTATSIRVRTRKRRSSSLSPTADRKLTAQRGARFSQATLNGSAAR